MEFGMSEQEIAYAKEKYVSWQAQGNKGDFDVFIIKEYIGKPVVEPETSISQETGWSSIGNLAIGKCHNGRHHHHNKKGMTQAAAQPQRVDFSVVDPTLSGYDKDEQEVRRLLAASGEVRRIAPPRLRARDEFMERALGIEDSAAPSEFFGATPVLSSPAMTEPEQQAAFVFSVATIKNFVANGTQDAAEFIRDNASEIASQLKDAVGRIHEDRSNPAINEYEHELLNSDRIVEIARNDKDLTCFIVATSLFSMLQNQNKIGSMISQSASIGAFIGVEGATESMVKRIMRAMKESNTTEAVSFTRTEISGQIDKALPSLTREYAKKSGELDQILYALVLLGVEFFKKAIGAGVTAGEIEEIKGAVREISRLGTSTQSKISVDLKRGFKKVLQFFGYDETKRWTNAMISKAKEMAKTTNVENAVRGYVQTRMRDIVKTLSGRPTAKKGASEPAVPQGMGLTIFATACAVLAASTYATAAGLSYSNTAIRTVRLETVMNEII